MRTILRLALVCALALACVALCVSAQEGDAAAAPSSGGSRKDIVKLCVAARTCAEDEQSTRVMKWRKARCVTEVATLKAHHVEKMRGPLRQAKRVSRRATKYEARLFNLPCELEEGDHAQECRVKGCKVKGLRKRARNFRRRAVLLYRIISQKRLMRKLREAGKEDRANRIASRIHRNKIRMQKLRHKKYSLQCTPQKSEHTIPPKCSVLARRMARRAARQAVRQEARQAAARQEPARQTNPFQPAQTKRVEAPKPPPTPPAKPARRRHVGPFGYAVASAGGDPHFTSFDRNVAYHPMIRGWFTFVQNDVVTVQAFADLWCMPWWIPNTCVRAIAVRIKVPESNEQLVATHGYHNLRTIINDGQGVDVNQHSHAHYNGLVLGGKFRIRTHHGFFHLYPHGATAANAELAVHVALHWTVITACIPRTIPHLGQTNGLFGTIGHHAGRGVHASLRSRDGTNTNGADSGMNHRHLWLHSWGGHQSNAMLQWAASHIVTNENGSNPPIRPEQRSMARQPHNINGYRRFPYPHAMLQVAESARASADAKYWPQESSVDAFLSVASFASTLAPEAKAKLEAAQTVTPRKMRFCRKLMKKAFSRVVRPRRDPWWVRTRAKCLSGPQIEDILENRRIRKEKRLERAKKWKNALQSCLMDAEEPKIAKENGAAVKATKKMKRKAVVALIKQVVIKAKAEGRSVSEALHKPKPSTIRQHKAKQRRRLAKRWARTQKKERKFRSFDGFKPQRREFVPRQRSHRRHRGEHGRRSYRESDDSERERPWKPIADDNTALKPTLPRIHKDSKKVWGDMKQRKHTFGWHSSMHGQLAKFAADAARRAARSAADFELVRKLSRAHAIKHANGAFRGHRKRGRTPGPFHKKTYEVKGHDSNEKK